jgi:paraquat-inducible protein B
MPRMIEKGFRAQLTIDSLVTGQLMVDLGFYPDTPVRLVGGQSVYPEIPTIESALGKLGKSLEKLNLEALFNEALGAVSGLSKIINSPELAEALSGANLAVKDARKLLQDVDGQVEPLAFSLDETITDFGQLAKGVNKHIDPVATQVKGTLRDYRKLGRDVDRQVEPLAKDIGKMARAISAAADQARATLKSADGLIEDNSPLMVDLKKMLGELAAAARSIRALTAYLERHPEALIQGKGRRR